MVPGLCLIRPLSRFLHFSPFLVYSWLPRHLPLRSLYYYHRQETAQLGACTKWGRGRLSRAATAYEAAGPTSDAGLDWEVRQEPLPLLTLHHWLPLETREPESGHWSTAAESIKAPHCLPREQGRRVRLHLTSRYPRSLTDWSNWCQDQNASCKGAISRLSLLFRWKGRGHVYWLTPEYPPRAGQGNNLTLIKY